MSPDRQSQTHRRHFQTAALHRYGVHFCGRRSESVGSWRLNTTSPESLNASGAVIRREPPKARTYLRNLPGTIRRTANAYFSLLENAHMNE